MMCYGRPRSFKVIEICTNREPLWDFLLISVQNMCLSSIVSEIKRFIGQKSQFLHHFTHPVSFEALTSIPMCYCTKFGLKKVDCIDDLKVKPHDPTVTTFDSVVNTSV